MSHSNRKQERELLVLQARLMQLKIAAVHAQKRGIRHNNAAPSQTLMHFAHRATGFISNKRLLKLAMLPSRWRHRLIVGGLLFVWEWYRHNHDALGARCKTQDYGRFK
ncbi:MAG: hypothetical protein Q4B82_00885 [Alysiella sp.]|uniref:hypothetical protein n=1 Tax=Alysiella sp. TaxID=1872483 RepID=UPI0026DA7FED|nr:hypothetical protein [Alysiella sp.]MDO4433123.1 hypothetical protein [Alysiella sp.]